VARRRHRGAGHVLAGLAEPAIPEGSVAGERLRSAGLRLMRARRADLATLERELPPTRTRRREWLGWFSRWTEIFRGRRAGGGAPLLVAGRRESFDAGTLRLIARAWPAPGLERHASPRVRLDLAVQLVPDPKPLTETIFEQPRAIDPAHAGHVFGETALELTLEDGLIYILTSAPPSASWDVGDEPASDPRPELPPGPPSPGVDFRSFGPPASTARSVGEAMFSATSEETGSADLNVVLVLLPRAPDRFRILPGEAPAAR